MADLSEISVEMAQKLMQEVGFEDRIIGVNMGGSTGNNEITIYSIKELASFLRTDHYDNLSQRGHGSMCYIDIDKMLRWIGQVYGDQELAEAMTNEMANAKSNAMKFYAARKLLMERLQQCDEVLGLNQKK